MGLKEDKLKAGLCVLLIILSVFFLGSGQIDLSSSGDREVVLVDISNGGDLVESVEVIDRYGDNALLWATEKEKNTLEERGFSVRELPSRTEITVGGLTFDIEDGPDLPSDMRTDGYDPGQEGLYLVHMLGPINPEWRNEIEENGVEVINYVPNHAYEVKMTPETAEEIEEYDFVDFVGPYHPAYKLPEDIETGKVRADFHTTPDSGRLASLGFESQILTSREKVGEGSVMTLNVSSMGELKRLARMDSLYRISNRYEPELHSEVEAQIVGGGAWIMDDEFDDPTIPYRKHGDFGAYINQIGYSGDGVTIAVADTGIGDGTLGDSGHLDFTGRVVGGHGFGELDQDEWADGHGHGTHVAGLSAGDSYHGSGEAGEYPGFGEYYMGQGLAYESDLYAAKIFSDDGSFLLEDDYFSIIEIPKQESDAHVHVNSWGSRSFGRYTESDSVYDTAVRDANRDTDHNEPMIITVSAGNAGPTGESTGSPGNAKNVITIGSTTTYMPDGGDYGGSDTDEISSISGFSSRGWTRDGRIKPDVVAPGQNVLSLGSPTLFDGPMYEWKSGTSMSNPVVAGAASVVVEWYEERFGVKPSPAMVRALLINTAEDLEGDGCRSEPIPNKDEGWGMVDLSKLEYPKDDPVPFLLEDQSNSLRTGESDVFEVSMDRENEPLKFTLTWTDKEAEDGDDVALKNDLNLEVTSPSGRSYRGNAFSMGWSSAGDEVRDDFDRKGDGWDDVNNVQNVYIHPDELEEGTYSVEVEGFGVPLDGTNDGEIDQDYSLIVYNGESSDMRSTEETHPRVEQEIHSNVEEEELTDRVERDPIRIESDEEFEDKAQENGWPGSGTEDDPFIIEDYYIDGNEEDSPIVIENVESHFMIRDNRLYNSNRSRSVSEGNSGILLLRTRNGVVRENELELNSYGVRLEESSDIEILNNFALNNHVGFQLSSSDENVMEGNVARKISHPSYGEGVSLEDSKENLLSTNQITNNEEGMNVEDSGHNLLSENEVSYNLRGISSRNSSDIEVDGGHISNNRAIGLYLFESNANQISQIEFIDNNYGVYIRDSEDISLLGNRVENSLRDGMRFFETEENTIKDNVISGSGSDGVSLSNARDHTFYSNEFFEDGINIFGRSVYYWNTHDIPLNNTVDEKSIFYLSDQEDEIISGETESGQIILANSTGMIIENNEISTGDIGMILGFSEENEIKGNDITDQRESITLRHSHRNRIVNNSLDSNDLGVYLVMSMRNSLSNNTIKNTALSGFVLTLSHNNLIFGNELSNNHVQSIFVSGSQGNTIYHNEIHIEEDTGFEDVSLAFDNGQNTWDHGGEGNYWSNYEERYPEAEESETPTVWDTPYVIDGDGNEDNYPLRDREPVKDLSVFILEPSFGEKTFEPEMTVRWDLKGAEGEVETRIRLNDNEWIDVDGSREYSFEDLEDGVHHVEVMVEDEEDVSSHIVEFEVITDVYVEITQPESGGIVRRSRVDVEWIAENMEYSEIRLEGEDEENEWLNVGKAREHTFRDLEDNDHTVSVRAFDEEGEMAEDSVDFSVKTVDVEITSPEENEAFNSREVSISWEHENADIHEVRVCGGRWDRAEEPGSFELIDLREGRYQVNVRVTDASGRRVTDSTEFWVDLTSPEVKIIEPEDSSNISTRDVKVRWEGYDNESGVEGYQVRINEGEWIDVGNQTEYTFEGVRDGNHTVEVRVRDRAGNTASDSVDFQVRTDPFGLRDIPRLFRDYWWLITIIAVAIVIVFDLLFWRKKCDYEKVEDLQELEYELRRHEPKEREDEYKL